MLRLLAIVVIFVVAQMSAAAVDKDRVHFPGYQIIPRFSAETATADDCLAGFCETASNYPQEDVNTLIASNPLLKEYFTNPKSADETPELTQRIGPEPRNEEYELCTTNVKTIAPKLARDVTNVMRSILQTEEEGKQHIYIEQCAEKATCQHSQGFPDTRKSYCKQKYTRQRLATFRNGTVFLDVFDVPCCCVCSLKVTDD